MRGLDKRLTAVEAKQAPAGKLAIYGEDLRVPGGLFVRTNPADDAGRLMTRDEARVDAEALGATTVIWVMYDDVHANNRSNNV